MDYSALTGSSLFKDIKNVGEAISGINFRTRKFNPETMIFQTGDVVDSLVILIKGSVRAEMVDYTGRAIKIEEIQVPEALAPAFIFGKNNIFPVNVISSAESELFIIDKSEFLRLLLRNEKILVNYLDMVSNRSQFLSEKIKFLNFKTIKSKLAQYILKLAGNRLNQVKLDRTQNDLADFFGVARPSVARALHDLEEMRIIETHGKYIKILSRSALKEFIND